MSTIRRHVNCRLTAIGTLSSTKMHKHWFHAISWHFGAYGDQTVHVHSCCGDADEIEAAIMDGTDARLPQTDCDWALIGVGRSCGGNKTRHWTQSLEARLEASEALAQHKSEL